MSPVVVEGGGISKLTFKEIWEEVAARGFSELPTEPEQLLRLKRWVNLAYREITDRAPWPFLEETAEGPAPLTIEDLGHVLSVSNLTTEAPLTFADRRTVVGIDPALDEAGTAEYWYVENETILCAYPVDTASTLRVRYAKAPAELAADDDVPIIPTPYQGLIVDGAVIWALKNRDGYEAAQFVRQDWERGIKQMTHALLKPSYNGEKKIIRTGDPCDYLG